MIADAPATARAVTHSSPAQDCERAPAPRRTQCVERTTHAASFAPIASASAYLKCHYLAAFTTAMLNNQPTGFCSPQTLVNNNRM
jgi:hypothetical protein